MSLIMTHSLFCFIPLLPLLCSSVQVDVKAVKASTLINKICPKTRNPTLCFQILASNPNASLRDLGLTSVDALQQSGFLASDTIRVNIIQGKDPTVVQRLRLCATNYVSANSDVADSRLLLKSNSFRKLLSKASALLAEDAACDRNFLQPSSEPADVKKATQNFEDVGSVLLIISKLLAGKNV